MKTLLSAVLVIGALSTSPIDVHADAVAPFGMGSAGSPFVPGGTDGEGVGVSGNSSTDDRVLLNFANADSVSIRAEGDASLPAPHATFSGHPQMDGNSIAAAIGRNREGHDVESAGSLPTDPETTSSPNSPEPEPATLSLLGTGIVGAASVLRRRLGRASERRGGGAV